MTLEEQHQQDMNDKIALEHLMIKLSLPSIDLPIKQAKLSVSMTLKVIESLQYHIWEIENKYDGLDQGGDDKPTNYPTNEQLEDEYRLQEEWDAQIIDEEQMRIVLAS